MSSLTSRIFRAGLLIAALQFLSRLLGLGRDIILARTVQGDALDLYFSAFRIPDSIYNLLILGTLSVAILPILQQAYNRQPERERMAVWQLCGLVAAVVGVLSVVAMIFAPELTASLVPGFSASRQAMTVSLSRVLLVTPVVFATSIIFAAWAQRRHQFFWVGLGPVFYNLGIIFGAVELYPRFGLSGLAWGVLFGAVAHWLVHITALFTSGFRVKLSEINFTQFRSLSRQVLHLAGPRLFAFDQSFITLILATVFGSVLGVGLIGSYNFAFNLATAALGLVGVATATAAFPRFAELATPDSRPQFQNLLASTANKLFLIAVIISIFSWVWAPELVQTVFAFSSLSPESGQTIVTVFRWLILSIPAQCVVLLLARAHYAWQDSWRPLWASLAATFIQVICAVFAIRQGYGLAGVAASASIAAIAQLFILISTIRSHVQLSRWPGWGIVKIICVSLALSIIPKVLQTQLHIPANFSFYNHIWPLNLVFIFTGLVTLLWLGTFYRNK